MKVPLDTHVVLWAVLSPSALSTMASSIIADQGNVILVSAVSAWEIATKVRIGKLPGAELLERDFPDVMEDAGYTFLPIDVHSALRAGRLLSEHRDPFDRMLAAQALEMDAPILSADAKLDSFAVRRSWLRCHPVEFHAVNVRSRQRSPIRLP